MYAVWFNLDTKEIEKEYISISSKDSEYPEENLQKGLVIDAVRIKHPDMFFHWFMKKKGYNVFRMSVMPDDKELLFEAIKKFMTEKQIYVLYEKGMPASPSIFSVVR